MSSKIEPALIVRELILMLNVDEKTACRFAQRGELPGFKISGAWLFLIGVIDEWIISKIIHPNERQA